MMAPKAEDHLLAGVTLFVGVLGLAMSLHGLWVLRKDVDTEAQKKIDAIEKR